MQRKLLKSRRVDTPDPGPQAGLTDRTLMWHIRVFERRTLMKTGVAANDLSLNLCYHIKTTEVPYLRSMKQNEMKASFVGFLS